MLHAWHCFITPSIALAENIMRVRYCNKNPYYTEKIHIGFCKSTLEVNKSSTSLAVRAELGRLPLESFIKTQTSLYLLRLNNDNINPPLKEAFHVSKILDKERFYSWFAYAKNIVSEIGFDIESTKKCQTIKEVKQCKHIIKDSSNDYNKNLILNKIKNLNGNLNS
jgi:hypothetical protein